MAELSGVLATAKVGATPAAIPDVLGWTVEPTIQTNPYATNQTSGWKKRTTGVKDWTATITIMQDDTAATPFTLGTSYTLEFHVDGGGSNYYSGDAIFQGVGNYNADINDGTNFELELRFEGNGALTANGSVPALA